MLYSSYSDLSWHEIGNNVFINDSADTMLVDQTDYHLRNSATDLTLSKPKTEFPQKSFKYSGAQLLNQLPNEAKPAESIYLFNKCIKT